MASPCITSTNGATPHPTRSLRKLWGRGNFHLSLMLSLIVDSMVKMAS